MGLGLSLGLGPGARVGIGVGLGVGVGLCVEEGICVGLDIGVSVGLGLGIGLGVSSGAGLGIGGGLDIGMALGLGISVGVGVGLGIGMSLGVGGRLPTLLLEPDGEIGGEGVVKLRMELLGGLVEMQMLTSGESNIWRIGSLQSVNLTPVEEVVDAAVVVSDVPLIFDEGDDDRQVGDGGGSVKHHKSGVSWMAAPTMLSPSSFPQTSEKVSGVKRDNKKENHEPLKIIAFPTFHAFPKARVFLAVLRNIRPAWPRLSLRTLIFVISR